MDNVLRPVARLAIGLWIGAVAAVGLLVAPRVFRFLDNDEQAGDLMAWIFLRVDWFGIVAAALFAFAARRHRIRCVTAAVLGVLAAVNAFVISPRILARGADLDLYHRVAEGVWTVILVAGVVLVARGPGER